MIYLNHKLPQYLIEISSYLSSYNTVIMYTMIIGRMTLATN